MKFIYILLFISSMTLNSKDLTNITLQLAWKYQFQFAGYIMAKEKGFYKDVGLDVNLKEYSNGLYALDEVKNKKAQFGIGRSDLITQRLNEKDKYLQLLALCQASPVQLQTIKENAISSISDLKGKKFLIYNNDKPIVSIFSMLNSVGITEKDITFVNSKTYDLKEITDGTADVLLGYSTISPYHYKKMGYTPIAFHPKDYGFDFYGDILFTMDEYANKNPKIVEGFYKASLKGWEYAFTNINETIKVIKAKYDTQKLSEDLLEFEANAFKELAFFRGVPFGEINPIKLEKIANTLNLLGKTRSGQTDFNNFIYNPNDNTNIVYLNKAEKAFIRNNPILKIGVQDNIKPIGFFTETGLFRGISNDIIEFISQNTGLRFVYIKKEKDELLDNLLNQNINLMITSKKLDNQNILITKPFFTLESKQFIQDSVYDKKVQEIESKTSEITFAIHAEQKLLYSIITKSIQQIKKEYHQAIHNKWVPKVVKEKFDWTIIWQITSVLGLIIIILLFKNMQQKKSEKERLTRQVSEKTKDLELALDEKALLLKELNHRVKNNMQTIVSLIRLQNDKIDDEKLSNILTTIQNRINAMSHLHELLYKQDNIVSIDASEYFELVIDELEASFDKDVEINYNINTDLVVEQAIYCGIILNELVTNAFKYAFVDDNGIIEISLSKESDNYFLRIKDNGIGYDINQKTKTLGLTLVSRLVKRQLHGSIKVDTLNGTDINIEWKNSAKN